MNLTELLHLDYTNIQDLSDLKAIIQKYHHHIDITYYAPKSESRRCKN